MTSTTSRRAILAGAAALPTLAATASVVAASADAELRRLWADYLRHTEAYDLAGERMRPKRAALDAEYDAIPGYGWEEPKRIAFRQLWDKHGLEPLSDAWNAAGRAMRDTILAIRECEAETIFGIGVKLCAVPAECDPEDYEEAIAAAVSDIDRLTGATFSEHVVQAEFSDDGDDDAEVQS